MTSERELPSGLDPELERRLRNRFDTPGLEATVEKLEVLISDLSLTGLGFTATDRLHPKHRYGFVIHGRAGDFSVRGEVVWCHISETVRTGEGDVVPRYRGGLRFDPLKSRDAQYLLELLELLSRQQHDEVQRES